MFSFAIAAPCDVAVRIYNLGGKMIRSVVERRHVAGAGAIRWDGRDNRGAATPPGVYTCVIATAERKESVVFWKL